MSDAVEYNDLVPATKPPGDRPTCPSDPEASIADDWDLLFYQDGSGIAIRSIARGKYATIRLSPTQAAMLRNDLNRMKDKNPELFPE